MKSSFVLLAALWLAGASLSAAQVFVLFDGSCGERIRYEQAVGQQPRMDYYSYNFSTPDGGKIIFETGTEGNVTQSYLPQNYVYCNDGRLSADLVARVNNGTDRVFMLLPTQQGGYLVQPVVMAASLQRMGLREFSYSSPLTSFTFNADDAIIGVDLSSRQGTGSKVYFEGRDNNACNGVYLFRQLSTGGAYPVIDYRLVPEIGITERRLGSDGQTTSGGVIVAREVNGMPVADYLRAICTSATALAGNRPQAYGSNPPSPAAPATYASGPVAPTPAPIGMAVQPESRAYGSAPPTTTRQTTHTVQRGETLYAISRQYGTTVEAIKAQNGMTDNTLYPGQQIAVATTVQPQTATAQTATSQTAPPPRATVPTMPYNAGSVANSNPGAAQPTPYGNSVALAARGATGEPVYGEDVHVVQPGETVASVALKYGYTTARFREMNDLGPAEVIRVGERLKTSDCNCPAATAPAPTAAATAAPAPQAYGTQPQVAQPQVAQPQPYNPGTVAAPSAYGGGTPVGSTAPAYTPRQPQPAAAPPVVDPRPTITNDPNFGQVVPNANRAPNTSMTTMEGRGGNTATLNAPATYGSPAPAAPTAYGGTPVGANVPTATAPAATPYNANRSFHLVQQGESLYNIARRYNLQVATLRQLNELAPTEVIVPGQKLYLN